MKTFVHKDSIVRKIWGNSEVILLIFAGAAAEFALNKAVDWLFFTNKLPADPIGRLFSTVRYAQEIVFADEAAARKAIGRMSAIHGGVERQRGHQIPDWAYRDVLYMLIDYSERAYALLQRPLTAAEQEELFRVFRGVGEGMHIPGLPTTYAAWQTDRRLHLQNDLELSEFTTKLFERYRWQLGPWRYDLLRRVQALLVPGRVKELLQLEAGPVIPHTIKLFKMLEWLRLKPLVQRILLPAQYLQEVRQLEQPEAA
jgi:hypothetical protein